MRGGSSGGNILKHGALPMGGTPLLATIIHIPLWKTKRIPWARRNFHSNVDVEKDREEKDTAVMMA